MTRPPTYRRRVDNTSKEIDDALAPAWEKLDLSKAGWGVLDRLYRHRKYSDLRMWADTKSKGGALNQRQREFIAFVPGPVIVPYNAQDALNMARQVVTEYFETKSKR